MTLSTLIRTYKRETSGNVAMMMAASIFVLIILAGGTVDMTNVLKDQKRGQDIADASVLAAALEFNRSLSTRQGRAAAARLQDEHLLSEEDQDEYSIRTTISRDGDGSFTVTSITSGATQHAFLGLIGMNETTWDVESKSQVTVPQAEIVLALDVSRSMLNFSKWPAMLNAAESFIEGVAPFDQGTSYVSVSILPFAENVNLGAGASVLLDPADGYAHSPNFIGCFRHSDGRESGHLQAYPEGDLGGDPFCPGTNSASTLFSTKEQELTRAIRGMDVGFGTGTDVAMRWVNRVLDPAWRNQMTWSASSPKPFTDVTQKYVILLTDGRVSRGDPDQNGVNRTQNSADIPSESQDELDEFRAQCALLQNQGDINLYTIGYSPDGVLNSEMTTALKNCTSGRGRYFAAGTENVEEIFLSIRNDMTEIYLSE